MSDLKYLALGAILAFTVFTWGYTVVNLPKRVYAIEHIDQSREGE